jgi:hypothetical protein
VVGGAAQALPETAISPAPMVPAICLLYFFTNDP